MYKCNLKGFFISMSESRYRSVCIKDLDSFAVACPIQISKYEILYDSMYDRAVARVTIKNISSKAIKTAYVCAQRFDDAGDDLGSTGDFALMDINLNAGDTTTPETDVILTDRKVSSISVKITAEATDTESPFGEYFLDIAVPQTPAHKR